MRKSILLATAAVVIVIVVVVQLSVWFDPDPVPGEVWELPQVGSAKIVSVYGHQVGYTMDGVTYHSDVNAFKRAYRRFK